MRGSNIASVATTLLCLSRMAQAKHVFAHYMVGTVTEAHAHQDIDDAKGMGLDGFALNIGDPYQPFVDVTLHDLFGYAEYLNSISDTPFYLYVSMDVYASGAACYAGSMSCNGPEDYAAILDWTLGSPAYYTGENTPNGFPMISTFSSGGFTNERWISWKSSLANQTYFIPDFDETTGFYGGKNSYDGWYYYWGNVVDGLFSWESAWPERGTPSPGVVGGAFIGDISPDLTVQKGAIAHGKKYMMGLSPLQYKNSYGTNVYRPGDNQMFIRMVNILSMTTPPDWIVVQTWNDGPESHYIGNIWPEQNTDRQPAAYMGPEWSHKGWQPMIMAFINAYKSNGGISDMVTPQGYEGTYQYARGVFWYKTILQDAKCINDDGQVDSKGPEQYWEKPDGFDSGKDSVNWAVLMPKNTQDYTLSIWSGNSQILEGRNLVAGLNYGNVPELNAGVQTMQVLDPGGNVFMTATGGRCVSDSCPDFIYNMNYQVIQLELGTATGTCTSSNTDIYVPPSLWTESNPTVQCIPPCAIILPPLSLGYTTTIEFSPLTTSVWSLDGGNTVTKTTTIHIPPLTTTAIAFWRISALATETDSMVFTPLQSIMPPSIATTLPATEATFVPVPSGSPQVSATFFQSQHSITFQPQATQSIDVPSASVPEVTFISATPTAICSTGCGTDSCAQFGGCSSGGSNDCGTDGCGGGCSVSGCDTGCGISCTTEVDPFTVSQGDVPYDTDANPDDPTIVTNQGLQGTQPNKVEPSVAVGAQQANAFNINAAQSQSMSWKDNPTDRGVANQVAQYIQSIMDSASEDFKNLPSGVANEAEVETYFGFMIDALNLARGPPTRDTLDDSAVTETLQLLSQAEAHSKAYSNALYQDAYISECWSAKRSLSRPLKRCTGAGPEFQGEISPPTNFAEIPNQVNCNTQISENGVVSDVSTQFFQRADILGAIEQGARYLKDNAGISWQSTNKIWDPKTWKQGVWSTRSAYPHVFGNDDLLEFNTPSCNQDNMLEFPIREDGFLVDASQKASAKAGKVGNSRVVFQFDPDTGVSIFCGVMVHPVSALAPSELKTAIGSFQPCQVYVE